MISCPSFIRKSSLQPFFKKGCVEIYHGCCLEILPKLDREFDWIVCDPPYGTETNGYGRMQIHGGSKGRLIKNDKNQNLLLDSVSLLEQKKVCCFAHPKNIQESISVLIRCDLITWHELIWNKKTAGIGNGIRYSHESILVAASEPLKIQSHKTIFDGIAPARKNAHPHEKPLSVIGSLLEILKPESVIDPFLGSGTTAVACLERNIPFVGIEIEKQWCELAAHRLSQDVML